MRIAYYLNEKLLGSDGRVESLLESLSRAGAQLYDLASERAVLKDTEVILSLGGDGTFLSAAPYAALSGVPIAGVNMGRLGFLSSCNPEDLPGLIFSARQQVGTRNMIFVETDCPGFEKTVPLSLNEVMVGRSGPAMLGVDVSVDGNSLPTYWADGLLVSTSSGSTAYNLSAGGPICLPDSRVLLITPVCPHNLNIRPLVVPDTSVISISLKSRSKSVILSLDNRRFEMPSGCFIKASSSELPLKVLRPDAPGFIDALSSRLLWGQDVRNSNQKQ